MFFFFKQKTAYEVRISDWSSDVCSSDLFDARIDMIPEVASDTEGSRMRNFRPIDRDTGYLLPPSVDEWLPEQHLARFVVEVIDGLDLSAMSDSYRGSGSASYHPALLLGDRKSVV